MKTILKRSAAILCIGLLAIATGGCETAGGSAATGGALGAGLGAIIGNQSGHAGEGALIGAAAGALTGLIVHDVKSRRARSAEQTAEEYAYTPEQGQRLTFEHVRVEPSVVQAGHRVEATAQYALLGASNGAQVTESWTLRQGPKEISQLSSYTENRTDGTWVSTLPFRAPENLQSGEYQIMYHARTSQTAISGMAEFVIQ